MSMAAIGVGTALAGSAASAYGSHQSSKASAKAAKRQNMLTMMQIQRRNRIADRLEQVANKLLNEEPISERERAFISQASNVADQQLKRIQKEAIESGLEAQAGTGFLKSGRMADQVRKLVLEGAERRSQIQLGREQAIQNALLRNRQQALQALQSAGSINASGQLQQGVGNPLAPIGAGLTSIGGSFIQGGLQKQANQEFLSGLKDLQRQNTQVDPQSTDVAAMMQAMQNSPFARYGG
jgi:hypothetical protein